MTRQGRFEDRSARTVNFLGLFRGICVRAVKIGNSTGQAGLDCGVLPDLLVAPWRHVTSLLPFEALSAPMFNKSDRRSQTGRREVT